MSKDDERAMQPYSDYLDYKSYDTLRDIIKTATARPAKPPKPAPPCERCVTYRALMREAIDNCETCRRTMASSARCVRCQTFLAALNGEVTP